MPAATTPTTTEDPDEPTTPTPAPGGNEGSPVPFGTTAAIGEGWLLRVDSFVPDATATVLAAGEFNEPPLDGQQYALARVSATYSGPDANAELFDLDVGAIATDETEVDMFSCDAEVPDELDILAEVPRGATVSGNVCLVLPAGDTAGTLLFATVGFVDDATYFALL